MCTMADYEHDCRGFWVLIGLTHEETEEFERLDAKIDLIRDAGQLYEAGGPPMTVDQKRWTNLSEKHHSTKLERMRNRTE